MDSVLDPNKFVEKTFDTTAGEGNHFIDGDTVRTKDGESIRISNINTPEVAHTDDYISGDKSHKAGSAYHKEVSRLSRENGFTEILRTGQKDVYGRSIGDMYNPDTGERMSYFLAKEGIVAPSIWADKGSIDQSVIGHSQRYAGAERDESTQEAFDVISEASKDDEGQLNFKTLALNEREYDEDIHAGVSLRQLDRTIDNKALKPLSTSFDTALLGMRSGFNGMRQAIGYATGNEAMETKGRIGVSEANSDIEDMPQVLVDYKDVGSISDGFSYLANNAIMSTPYMANTIASAAAGAAAGAVAGSIVPVGGTIVGAVVGGTVGLASPTAIYAGQVYNSQDEKNWKVALASGFGQGVLDRLGLKGLSSGGKTLKGVLKEAEDTLVTRGMTRVAAKKKLADASKTELMGLVEDADKLVAQQLSARNVTRTILNRAAKGAGAEAVTEAAQETLAQMGENYDEENLGLFDHSGFNSEFIDRITNAAIAGGTLGGAFGGVGGVREVGGWADAAWERGKPRTSFEDTLANLENQDETIEERLELMQRGVEDTTDLALRIDSHIEQKGGRDLTEKAIDSFKNLPMLWRGMMRSRMTKDSLVRSSSYRQLGAMFGATLGKIKAGHNYEDSMHFIAQKYSNMIGGNEKIWYRGLAGSDAKSKAKFNNVLERANLDYNNWHEENWKKPPEQRTEFDWSRYDNIKSAGWDEKYSKDPNKNMIQQFMESREKAANIMRDRQNNWWNKNAKPAVDPETGEVVIPKREEKIKKLHNYFGKFKAMDRTNIGQRRGNFETLLRSEYAMSKEAANELTTKILDGEALDGMDQSVFDLITKGVPATHGKKRTMGLSQNPKFNEFFHQDAFHNFREGARMAARFETYHKFVGRDNWRVAKLLDQAAREGVPKEEVDQMALAIQSYLEAQSGNYKRPPKGSYGERALGVQRGVLVWSLLTSLPLSALSSTVELALVTQGLTNKQIFNNIQPFAHELASGMGRGLHRWGAEMWTGREYVPEGEHMQTLTRLGYLNWEAGAASTVGATEMSDWSKKLVDRFFKYNMLQDLTNATRAMKVASYTDFMRDHVERIKNEPSNSEAYRFSFEQIRNLGVPVDRFISLMDMDENSMTQEQKDQYAQFEDLAQYTFINQTVALPGAANRPLLYQDPRLALFTQFNGYVSTFTANHLPKMWSEYVSRGRPSIKFNTFAMMATMIFLGFASQYLKDWLKYGEPSPYLDTNEKLRRAVNSSGLLGQGERALNFIWPTFEKQSSSAIGAGFDMITDEMPAMGPVRRLLKSADAAYQGDVDMAQYNALRAAPVLGPMTHLTQKLSGVEFEHNKN